MGFKYQLKRELSQGGPSSLPADVAPRSLAAGLSGLGYNAQRQILSPVAGVSGDVQAKGRLASDADVQSHAAAGIASGGGAMPHAARIQRAFGHHDISGVQAHVGGGAAQAAQSIGASAYAMGNHVAFANTPSLHTAAHEAAHVVQQRAGVQLSGGVGRQGDRYEAHADAVADRVVQGQSAQGLLDQMAAPNVQRSGGGQVQRRGGPKPVSIGVPAVMPIAAIADPVARNGVINASYQAFDQAMTTYLGKPTISSWVTYAQHASRGAGENIRLMDGALRTLNTSYALMVRLGIKPSPLKIAMNLGDIIKVVRNAFQLITAPGMVGAGVSLAFQKSGITSAMLQGTLSKALSWNPIKNIQAAAEVAAMVVLLIQALPKVIAAIAKILANLKTGNQQIYEAMAPAYRQFLMAANGSPNGVPGPISMNGKDDPNGLIQAGFVAYGEVKTLADQADGLPSSDPQAGQLLARRQQKAHQGNMMIVTQEQISAQPLFDQMKAEFAAVGSQAIELPSGQFILTQGNWADFHTRMGYSQQDVPNMNALTPSDFTGPNSIISSNPKSGTILDLFSSKLNDKTAAEGNRGSIHNAPRAIRRMP